MKRSHTEGSEARPDVLRQLHVAFAGRIPAAVVTLEFTRAQEELRGQVLPGAAPEMTYRLVAHRLLDRAQA